MNIRRATPTDAEACWNIRNQAIRHGCKCSYAAAVIDVWTPDAQSFYEKHGFIPVREILLEVNGLGELDNANIAMEHAGYHARGETGIPGVDISLQAAINVVIRCMRSPGAICRL